MSQKSLTVSTQGGTGDDRGWGRGAWTRCRSTACRPCTSRGSLTFPCACGAILIPELNPELNDADPRVDLCCVLQAGEGCHMCRPAAPELISVAIPLYLSVSVISASEMSKIAKTFNDYWTKVLQNLGFRRVRVRIHCPCEWNLTSPQPGPEYAVPAE